MSSVLILPPGPIVDRHRRPQERLQAARRPPAYPNQARIIAPVTPSHPSAVLTPSTCMNRWIRAKVASATSYLLDGKCIRTAKIEHCKEIEPGSAGWRITRPDGSEVRREPWSCVPGTAPTSHRNLM